MPPPLMETRQQLASEPLKTSAPAQVGDDLHLSLSCPKCGATGWIGWANLKRGMSCPKCACHFHVARNGQLSADEDLPHVRFHCPRCHQAGTIPAIFRVRKAKCGVCKLPLEIGPDEQLHGVKEAANLRRETAAAQALSAAAPSKFSQFFLTAGGQMRSANIVLVSVVAVGLLAAAVAGASALFTCTPESQVRSFTYTCLAGDWNAAEKFLPPEDDVALVEFQRWRSFYFTSILDKHRPAGDKVHVAVVREGENPADTVFVVTLSSPVLGSREVREHWHERDGRWEFDVVSTLAHLH